MKHLNQNQEFRFNEVLFEHRNKEYGAYVLRNESDRLLTKALFVGVSLLAAISITPFVISAFNNDAPSEGPGGVVIEFVEPVVPPDVPVTPPVKINPIETAPQRVRQYDATVPTPSSTAPDDTKKTTIPDDAVAGLKNDFTAEPVKNDSYTPIISDGIGKGPIALPRIDPPKPQPDNNEIANPGELSAEAVFAGGIDAFRNKVMNNFDGSQFEDSGETMKTVITFIVEKDGTISGLKANGKEAGFNSEAIRTIKSIKGLWKPAKNKQGENVRSYFKFPISMNFE